MSEASDITNATNVRDTNDIELHAYAAGRKDTADNAQAFFTNLRESVRPPHVGDSHRTFVTQLLLQAEAAGLYSPKEDA